MIKTLFRSRSGRTGLVVVLLLLAAGVALGWRWWNRSHNETPQTVLRASGVIEVEEIEIASELGGRVNALYVDEGEQVEEGAPLVQLDDALARAQLAQAEAVVEEAQAALRRAEAGATAGEIAQATAAYSQSLAALQGAQLVWEAAQALVQDPQQITAQYYAALGMASAAQAMVVNTEQIGGTTKEISRLLWYNAANNLRDAQAAYSLIYWQNRGREQEGHDLTQAEIDLEAAAWRRVEDAERMMQIGEMSYNLAQTTEAQNNAIAQAYLHTAQLLSFQLSEMISEPLSLAAQAAQADAQVLQAQAAVGVAQAALDRALAGADEADLDILRARLHQAQAAVEALLLQVERTTLHAPVGGVVMVRSIHEGELAAPGIPLLTLANLDTIRLTLYIPEQVYGQVQLGQEVAVYVDSFPDRVFRGVVVYISSQPEFTPKDVQTEEERVHLVYAVRVRLPNPDHLLSPGMPADAEILLGRE